MTSYRTASCWSHAKVRIETGGSLPWTREHALSPPAHSSCWVYVVLSYLLVPWLDHTFSLVLFLPPGTLFPSPPSVFITWLMITHPWSLLTQDFPGSLSISLALVWEPVLGTSMYPGHSSMYITLLQPPAFIVQIVNDVSLEFCPEAEADSH